MDNDNTAPETEHDLASFLGKILRVHVSDGRMFVGSMKCTDKVIHQQYEKTI